MNARDFPPLLLDESGRCLQVIGLCAVGFAWSRIRLSTVCKARAATRGEPIRCTNVLRVSSGTRASRVSRALVAICFDRLVCLAVCLTGQARLSFLIYGAGAALALFLARLLLLRLVEELMFVPHLSFCDPLRGSLAYQVFLYQAHCPAIFRRTLRSILAPVFFEQFQERVPGPLI